ncbi:MAG TPA: glycosyltransferase family 4 protein, partial [Candidatus Krumholzibacteria bacterium]|nr:glycosyltransferase family 4 protein [Candidatus Krumholzibacteria bacterium]
MKLAICSAGELFGGVERQILDLCTYWRRSGHGDPLVVLFHDHELAKQLRGRGVEPVILRGGKYDPRLAGRFAALVKEHGIDVVHVHGYRAMITCALARDKVPFRIVKTEHGLPETGGGTLVTRLRTRLNARLDQHFTRRRADAVCYVTKDIASRYDRIHNQNCCIPPGESRVMTIRAAARPGELTLVQTGWRIETFNADDVVIEPSGGLLLSMGRRDATCREYAGSDDPGSAPAQASTVLSPVSLKIGGPFWLVKGKTTVRYVFGLMPGKEGNGAVLRIHTADQSASVATELAVNV